MPKCKVLPPRDTDEYWAQRERNNLAVKKSREKSRLKAQQSNQRIEKLRQENKRLEQKVSLLAKELSVLKDLFLVHAKGFEPNNETGEESSRMQPAVKCEQRTEVYHPTHNASESSRQHSHSDGYDEHPVNTAAVLKDHEYSASVVKTKREKHH